VRRVRLLPLHTQEPPGHAQVRREQMCHLLGCFAVPCVQGCAPPAPPLCLHLPGPTGIDPTPLHPRLTGQAHAMQAEVPTPCMLEVATACSAEYARGGHGMPAPMQCSSAAVVQRDSRAHTSHICVSLLSPHLCRRQRLLTCARVRAQRGQACVCSRQLRRVRCSHTMRMAQLVAEGLALRKCPRAGLRACKSQLTSSSSQQAVGSSRSSRN